MIYTIYKITNNVTGKVYIGCTSLKKPHYRLAEHLRTAFKKQYRSYGRFFYKDIRKHGRDAYSFSAITKTSNPHIAKHMENKFIKAYREEGLSLNSILSCGVIPREVRTTMSNSLKGNKNGVGNRTEASKRRISEGMAKSKTYA